MSLYSRLFKVSPKDEIQSSQIVGSLRASSGTQTGQWLALQKQEVVIGRVIARPWLAADNHPRRSTAKSVDKVDVDDSPIYSPPVETSYADTNAPQAPLRQAPPKGNLQVQWIEEVFDALARNADAFNSSSSDKKQIASVYRSEYTVEATPTFDSYLPVTLTSLFKGHISTNNWAMLMQGYASSLEIYILPSENLLQYTVNDIRDSNFKPFMIITSEIINGQFEWNIKDRGIILFDMLPLLAKELFSDLIRIGGGKANDPELLPTDAGTIRLEESATQSRSSPLATSADPSTTGTERTLRTWDNCRELLNTINSDLLMLAKNEEIAFDTAGGAPQAAQPHELSSDLRSLSGFVSGMLSKHTRANASTRH